MRHALRSSRSFPRFSTGGKEPQGSAKSSQNHNSNQKDNNPDPRWAPLGWTVFVLDDGHTILMRSVSLTMLRPIEALVNVQKTVQFAFGARHPPVCFLYSQIFVLA